MSLLPRRMMVPPADRDEANRLRDILIGLKESHDLLPGLAGEVPIEVLVGQLIESQRRARYIQRLRSMQLGPAALNGTGSNFDPLKAAILKQRGGDHDEACWLVLLSTHFGRNRRTGWQLAGDFYGRLGHGDLWDWPSTSADVVEVRAWLEANRSALRARGGGFGNHRKYESLNAWERTGTGQVLATYVAWVGDGTHAERFAEIAPDALSPRERFASLYRSLDSVSRFGRTARFDFLSTLGKIGLVELEADSAHLSGATGPLAGSRLLLDGSRRSRSRVRDLEARLSPVQQALDVSFDVLEDALCNWQKSPQDFMPFRG
ncbi:hypothetical protein GCM10023169_14010 [Georgenia halophila]|uniref:Alpha-glutamyl/putrescinyl thymine pyrophosphorylase clade 3 domain-containing protein n=1 Tax=Georgenia halophila TaxID=620889 RepID=A0ABP8L237_9MICO